MNVAGKNSQSVKSIYVIFGKDDFLVNRQFVRLIDSLIKPEDRGLGLWQADSKTVTAAEVFDELRTQSFLSDKKVVVIKDADKFVTDNRESLERYFDNPSDVGVLVMTVSKWAGNTRLAKKLKSFGELITAAEIRRKDLWSFVSSYARDEHGKNISRPVAELMIDFAGDEPGRVCREVDKLAAFVGQTSVIAAKDVEALTGHNRIYGAFEVIDSMVSKNVGRAISQLRNMFASDRSAEYTCVGAFAFHFRRMFSAKALLADGVSVQQAARQLNIWRDKVFFSRLSKISLEQIGSHLQELARIDYRIKTGRATARAAIESFVVGVASE